MFFKTKQETKKNKNYMRDCSNFLVFENPKEKDDKKLNKST